MSKPAWFYVAKAKLGGLVFGCLYRECEAVASGDAEAIAYARGMADGLVLMEREIDAMSEPTVSAAPLAGRSAP